MKNATQYARETFPNADKTTILMIAIAYLDGAKDRSDEILAEVRAGNAEMEENCCQKRRASDYIDYGAIREEYEEREDENIRY